MNKMNNKAALEFDKMVGIIIVLILLGVIIAFIVISLSGMLNDLGGFGSGTMDNLNKTADALNV
jgi:hypothetical protein